MNTAEKMRYIMRFLRLLRKSICSILGITRSALGGWLDNSAEPDKTETEKINALFLLVEGSGISAPLFRGYVENPIGGFPFSILDCLMRKEYLDKAPEMLCVADRLSRERERRIESRRADGSKLSEAEKEVVLEDNLNCLCKEGKGNGRRADIRVFSEKGNRDKQSP